MAKNFRTVLDAVRAAGATKLHELESAFAEDSSWLQMRCNGVTEQIGQLQRPAAMPKRRGRPPRAPKVRSRPRLLCELHPCACTLSDQGQRLMHLFAGHCTKACGQEGREGS